MKWLVSAVLVCSAAALAEAPDGVTRVPSEMKWMEPDSVPKGAQVAMLHGDMKKPGPFFALVRMPAGYEIPLHWHPAIEQVTVISGVITFSHEDGSKESLPQGGFSRMPGKMKHSVKCTSTAPCMLQAHATGPWAITYVNPSDDPRKQKTSAQAK